MNEAFEAERSPDLDAVWEWFTFQNDLIADELFRVLRVLSGKSSPGEVMLNPAVENRFRGCTPGEVEEYFEHQRMRLELVAMLGLLVTTEAVLRIDFDTRVKLKLKDNRSRKFRQIRRERVRLDEDILRVLAQELQPPRLVGDFRGALKLRHWLAHGAYWMPKLGRKYAPGDIFDICKALVEAL